MKHDNLWETRRSLFQVVMKMAHEHEGLLPTWNWEMKRRFNRTRPLRYAPG